jgi:hypothetical protein
MRALIEAHNPQGITNHRKAAGKHGGYSNQGIYKA